MNTITITAAEAHARIEMAAKTAPTQVRDGRNMQVGDIAHQGDVYLQKIGKKPAGYTVPTKTRQLAPGTTQGSRHCITEGPKLFVSKESSDPLLGPVIVADADFTLTHPEHAHHLLGAGVYRVGYQLDVAEQERSAVRD